MKSLRFVTLLLVVLGALNWGLMGLFQLDVIATLFAGPQTTVSRLLYILIGLSGLYQLVPLLNMLAGDAEDEAAKSAMPYNRTAYDRDRLR
jgi:uncharacterized protein